MIKEKIKTLNPIIILISYFLLIICVFLPIDFTGLMFMFFLITILSFLVRVDFSKYIYILINIFFLFLIIEFFNMFIVKDSDILNWGVAFSLGSFDVYWYSFWVSFELAFKFYLFLAIGLFFSTIMELESLTYAFKKILYPLKFLKIPIDDIAIILTLVVRFFPILKNDLERLSLASSSREINFKKRPYLVVTKFKFFLSFVTKLIEDAFVRSEQISISMENRGYIPSKKRTYYEKYNFNYLNYFFILFIFFILIFFIFMSIEGGNIIPRIFDPEYYYV